MSVRKEILSQHKILRLQASFQEPCGAWLHADMQEQDRNIPLLTEPHQQFQSASPELTRGWMLSAEDTQSNREDLHDAAMYRPRTRDLFAEVLQGELCKAGQNPRLELHPTRFFCLFYPTQELEETA